MRKMTSHVITFVIGIALLQGAHGSARIHGELVQKHIEEDIRKLNEVTVSLRKSLDEVQISKAQVTAEKQQLHQRLAAVHPKCRGTEDLAKHVTNLRKWDFDSCVDLTDALDAGEDLFFDGFSMGWNMATTMGNILMDLLNCPSINPVTAIKCYNNNFSLLKEAILKNKADIQNFFIKSKNVLFDIRLEFDKCVGLPLPSKVYLQNYINQIPEDCENKY